MYSQDILLELGFQCYRAIQISFFGFYIIIGIWNFSNQLLVNSQSNGKISHCRYETWFDMKFNATELIV